VLGFLFFFCPVRVNVEGFCRGLNCFRYGFVRQSASRCCIGSIISQQYSALYDPTSYLSSALPIALILCYNPLFLTPYKQTDPTSHSLSDLFLAFQSLASRCIFVFFSPQLSENVQPTDSCRTSLDDRASRPPPSPPPRPTLSHSPFDEVYAICAFNYQYIQVHVILTWLGPFFFRLRASASMCMCMWMTDMQEIDTGGMSWRVLEICECHVLFDRWRWSG